MSSGSKFFSVMVVGDNPEELMKKYDNKLEVEPYIKYKYADASKLQKNAIKILNEIINDPTKFGLSIFQIDYFKERKKAINNMSPFEYYQSITDGLYYDKNGNALSEVNPNGKWSYYRLGKNFSLPLKLKSNKEAYEAVNSDINWDAMNMQNTNTYEIVWDLVHGIKSPETEEEKKIYNNMKDKTKYFSNFKDKESYVAYNCAYWNYGYLDENGWKDMDDDGKELDWITNFFDRFVSKLKPNDKVTIYECSRSDD